MSPSDLPAWRDKPLFTPGPLTTSRSVKQAMLRDLGSRDHAFIETVRAVRAGLLEVAGVAGQDYEAVPMQGSGTFAVESVLTTAIPRGGKALIVVNGAYGRRMVHICETAGIACSAVTCPENATPDAAAVAQALAADAAITHVAVVHCETTTGIVNPLEAIGAAAHGVGKGFIVDAMSSFGAVPIDFEACRIDYLTSSANKCIEGVPGFAFVIARRAALLAAEGQARSLSLDLAAQWRGLEQNGQFRFTPPTHALLAFRQALDELALEGGVPGRNARYRANHACIAAGMKTLGFQAYLDEAQQGPIITSYRYPAHPNFRFDDFYGRLNAHGYVIYPGKVSDADCFRIGHIGRLFEPDMRDLLRAIEAVLREMALPVPLTA